MVKIVDMTDALKQVREYTCPKCEGETCQCPQNETMEVSNADKKINSPAYQNYKAGDKEHYKAADDLEEQKRQLEEEIKCLSEEMDSMIQEKRQEGFAVRYLDPKNGKRLVAAYKTKKDADDKAAQLKRDGAKDISITQHTLNFKEEVLDEASPTIAKVKDIAKNKQAAKIDGTTVDLFTASAISQVYDKVNDVNKKKMDGMKIIPLANIAMKLLKNDAIKEKNND